MKNTFMAAALEEAHAAARRGEVPVGAVVVSQGGEIIARDGNRTIEQLDPTAHAEMLVLRKAAQTQKTERLVDFDLYVTIEPCPMCAQAISLARIRRLYYGAGDEKGGGVDHGPRLYSQSTCHHAPEVYGGIAEVESSALLRTFFKDRRQGIKV